MTPRTGQKSLLHVLPFFSVLIYKVDYNKLAQQQAIKQVSLLVIDYIATLFQLKLLK